MTNPTRADISRRQQAGGRNKRIKAVAARVVGEYLNGRPAEACMQDLVRAAKEGVK